MLAFQHIPIFFFKITTFWDRRKLYLHILSFLISWRWINVELKYIWFLWFLYLWKLSQHYKKKFDKESIEKKKGNRPLPNVKGCQRNSRWMRGWWIEELKKKLYIIKKVISDNCFAVCVGMTNMWFEKNIQM